MTRLLATGRRRGTGAALSLVGGLLAFLLLASGASGSSPVDQALTGNPNCNPTALQGGTGIAYGPIRQEFAPSMPTLTGVDLCIYVFNTQDVSVEVNVRRGTAFNPETVLLSTTAIATQSIQWVHVPLGPMAVTPGEKLVIEASGYFGWRSTCAAQVGACDHVDGDLYPAGESTGEGVDYAFRTYGSNDPAPGPPDPPLTVQWGDLDCSGLADGSDALVPLSIAAGVTPPPAQGQCPDLGQPLVVLGQMREWGDVDCLGGDPIADALAIVQQLAIYYYPYARAVSCPVPGQFVNLHLNG